MIEFKGKITEGGKIIIPPEYQWALEAHVGDEVTIRVADEARDIKQAIRYAQEIVKRYVPQGVSLADELIADRRAEAQNE